MWRLVPRHQRLCSDSKRVAGVVSPSHGDDGQGHVSVHVVYDGHLLGIFHFVDLVDAVTVYPEISQPQLQVQNHCRSSPKYKSREPCIHAVTLLDRRHDETLGAIIAIVAGLEIGNRLYPDYHEAFEGFPPSHMVPILACNTSGQVRMWHFVSYLRRIPYDPRRPEWIWIT